MKKSSVALLLLVVSVIASGCYYYEPYPVYYPPAPPPYPSYDYIWDSAIRAAQDVGIQITSSNRNAGTIFGQRDRVGVTLQVIQQPDGKTRVELTTEGAKGSGSAVSDDFYRAFDRYMGRR